MKWPRRPPGRRPGPRTGKEGAWGAEGRIAGGEGGGGGGGTGGRATCCCEGAGGGGTSGLSRRVALGNVPPPCGVGGGRMEEPISQPSSSMRVVRSAAAFAKAS